MSSHCFTESESESSSNSENSIPYVFEGERREFSLERFELSKRNWPHLESAFSSAASCKVPFDADKTGSVNDVMIDEFIDGERYCVYFDLSAKRDADGRYILFQIRSAYRKYVAVTGRQAVRLGTLIDQALGLRSRNRPKRRREK